MRLRAESGRPSLRSNCSDNAPSEGVNFFTVATYPSAYFLTAKVSFRYSGNLES